jgi:SPP1 gp7 family putative phage head morphogenesis protein
MSVNQTLFERMTRHLLFLAQLGAGEAKWIERELKRNYFNSLTQKWLIAVDDIIRMGNGFNTLSSVQLSALRSLGNELQSTSKIFMSDLQNKLLNRLKDIARSELEFEFRLYQKTIPIEYNWKKPSEDQIESLIMNQPLSGKPINEWFNNISTKTVQDINQQIRLGLLSGESPDDIALRIRGKKSDNYHGAIYNTSLKNAKAIARTAVINANNIASTEFYKKNQNIIKHEDWVITLDTRTCPICMRAEAGAPYEVGKGPKPPLHLNCRCVRVAVTKSFRELGLNIEDYPESTRAAMDGQAPEYQTYPQWLKTQPRNIIYEALGRSKGKLFLDGSLKVTAFTNPQNRILTLQELRRKERDIFEDLGI